MPEANVLEVVHVDEPVAQFQRVVAEQQRVRAQAPALGVARRDDYHVAVLVPRVRVLERLVVVLVAPVVVRVALVPAEALLEPVGRALAPNSSWL